MRDRRDPWKWPLCIGLTLAVFLGSVFLVPRDWIEAFLSPLTLSDNPDGRAETRWLVVLPPPPIEAVPDRSAEKPDREPPPERDPFHRDPDWWTRGWAVKTEAMTSPETRPAVTDSVAILLTALGVERDFRERARPDSLLASRLFLMRIEDSFALDELKPYLSAMARSRDYADLYSRVADMYDNFLQSEIITPD